MSIRYSYALPTPGFPSWPSEPSFLRRREDAFARERRIFGGGFDDDGGDGDDDDGRDDNDVAMKRGMLDVVLGLFDGLDYEDEEFGFHGRI